MATRLLTLGWHIGSLIWWRYEDLKRVMGISLHEQKAPSSLMPWHIFAHSLCTVSRTRVKDRNKRLCDMMRSFFLLLGGRVGPSFMLSNLPALPLKS